VVAAGLIALVALTGCTGGGGDSTESATAGSVGGGEAGSAPAPARDLAGTRGAALANRPVVTVRSVIRTGEVELQRRDLDAARAEVTVLLGALGGSIDHEATVNAPDGSIRRSTLVLRVPVARFEEAMAGLKEVGRVRHSDTQAEDVTTEVIDVDERVETLRTSLDRLQSYQREAADVDDLIRYEQQITERESELQSLRAQQAHLADQTSLSTLTVRLVLPPAPAQRPGTGDRDGFLAGLGAGWTALTGSLVVLLTVLGAVLPFAVVAVLLGLPAWWLLRRGQRQRADASWTKSVSRSS